MTEAMKTYKIIALTALAALAASCAGDKGWSVSGKVDGIEEGTMLAIEAGNGRSWYVLDSVAAGPDGKFEYRNEAPSAFADILRVTLPGQGSIYFPVSGTDAVTLEADASNFAGPHKLAGTTMAGIFSAVDSIVASTSDIADLQRKLVGFITSDTTGVVAYYTVRKSKGSQPVFNPNESMGNRIYGAAAQVFAAYHPDDARGNVLKQAFFEGKQAMGRLPQPESTVLEATESGLIDITRYDNKGTSHSLADVAGKNKVVVLSFADYSTQSSPAYNAVLFDVYKKYKDRGMEIYQLSFDADEVAWKEAARNLPWITVWNAPTDGASVAVQYNVGAVPLTYVIANGEIAARVENPADIDKSVAKYF